MIDFCLSFGHDGSTSHLIVMHASNLYFYYFKLLKKLIWLVLKLISPLNRLYHEFVGVFATRQI